MIPNNTLLYAMLMSANKDETAVHVYEALLVVWACLPLEFRNLLCTNFSQLEFYPRGYPLIWPIRGCAAGQGMVFGLSVLNRVCDFVRVCPKQGI